MKLKQLLENEEQKHIEDLAYDEMAKMEQNPKKYYRREKLSKEEFEGLIKLFNTLDGKQFAALARNQFILDAIKDNYDYADDTGASSYIAKDVMITVLKKLGAL